MEQEFSLSMDVKKIYWDHKKTKIRGEIPLINGKERGIRKWYHENGFLYKQYTVFMNGLIYGLIQQWNYNKTRNRISTDKSDSGHGPRIEFEYGN